MTGAMPALRAGRHDPTGAAGTALRVPAPRSQADGRNWRRRTTVNNRPTIVAVFLLAGLVLSVAGAPNARAQVGKNMGVLNPNTAGAEELAGLPGLNSDLAAALSPADRT